MQSDNPDIQWALDLLKPDPTIQPNIFSKYFAQIPCLALGPALACYVNHSRGLPKFSRPYYHVLTTAGLLLIATLADNHLNKTSAKRDAVLRDYIIRHPEDFPPPERKKYGEVFMEFVPIR